MAQDLGDLLVMAGLITDDQLETARTYRKSLGGKLGTIVTKLGFLTDDRLTRFIAEREGLRIADLEDRVFPIDLVRSIPREMVEKHECLPLSQKDGVLQLAISDPTDFNAIEEIQFVTGKRVELQLASHAQMQKAIVQVYDELETGSSPLLTSVAPKTAGALEQPRSEPALRHAGTSSQSGLGALKSAAPAAPVAPWEALAPALIPLLISKGLITEHELRETFDRLEAAKQR